MTVIAQDDHLTAGAWAASDENVLDNIFVPMACPNSLASHVPLHFWGSPQCQPCLNTLTLTYSQSVNNSSNYNSV